MLILKNFESIDLFCNEIILSAKDNAGQVLHVVPKNALPRTSIDFTSIKIRLQIK